MRVNVFLGPREGKTCDVGLNVSPTDLLGWFAERDLQWEIVFESAKDEEEWFAWARADLVMRAVRALLHQRPVRFLEREYRAGNREESTCLAGELEDAIVASGVFVHVEVDDESGVTLGVKRGD